MYIYIQINICIYIQIYICIFTYSFINTHIYIHISKYIYGLIFIYMRFCFLTHLHHTPLHHTMQNMASVEYHKACDLKVPYNKCNRLTRFGDPGLFLTPGNLWNSRHCSRDCRQT